MTDVNPNVVANDAPHTSQIIEERLTHETPRPTNQMPEVEAPKEEPKSLSTREAIEKAFDEQTKAVDDKAKAAADAAKEEAKTEVKTEAKVDKARAEDGKFAKAEVEAKADKGAPEVAASERAAPEERQSEGRKYSEPPARFLPEAREKWANVPANIKAEFHRVSQEMEAETTKYRQSHERYEQLRQYDDTARQNGRDLTQSLAKVVEVERALAQNPIAGLDAVLREIGPRKADGSPLTLLEVAQHIVQNPQSYHQSTQQNMQQGYQPQVQQQQNPDIEALRGEINNLKAQQVIPVIDRFIEAHQDYHALENQIASILESGVIEKMYGTGLSVDQKLAEAYRMAGGRAPSQFVQPEASPAPVQSQARPVDLDGQKSVRGAPNAGQTGEAKPRFKSNREAMEYAVSQVYSGIR